MGYLEMVKEDVKSWMVENEENLQEQSFEDIQSLADWLNDALWCEDSVTGNASGSYYFNNYESKEAVLADMETVTEALQEFCDKETIADKFLNEEWEYFDVTARCYILGTAIWEVLEENKEEFKTLLTQEV